jgi:uncharacterized membrane protein YphA (DoxX/SURF4 family)
MASSIVLTSLSVFLGLYFVFVGLLKVTPLINSEMNRETRRLFVRFAKVVPFASLLGIKVSPMHYRLFVGSLEILSGIILTVIPGRLKQVANVILILLTTLAIHSHYMIDDKFERIAPSIVFFFMLSCRLVVQWQLSRMDKKKATEQQVGRQQIPATDSKRKKTE